MKASLLLSAITCLAAAAPGVAGSRLYSRSNPRPVRRDGELARLRGSEFNVKNMHDPQKMKDPLGRDKDSDEVKKLQIKCVWGSGGTENLARRRKRGENKFVGLRDNITLGWTDVDEEVLVDLDATWEDMDDIKVMNMEDWLDAVEAVDCSAPHMFLDFSDHAVYGDAKEAWAWINDREENEVILFANHPKCGDPDTREPFKVMAVEFDDTAFKITFTVDPFDSYSDFLATADLTYKTTARPDDELGPVYWNPNNGDVVQKTNVTFEGQFDVDARKRQAPDLDEDDRLQKRQKFDFDFSVNKDFGGRTLFHYEETKEQSGSTHTVSADLICAECGTRGEIQVVGRIKWGGPLGAVPISSYVEFKSRNVQAIAKLRLLLHGQVRKDRKSPLYGVTGNIEVKHLFEASLDLAIGAGYVLDVTADTEISFGVTGKMQDGSFKICLWGCSPSRSGWNWEWQKHKPVLENAEITAQADIFLYVAAGAYVRILGESLSGGVAALAPHYTGLIHAQAGQQALGFCGHPKATAGVEFQLSVGYKVFAYTGADFMAPDREWVLFNVRFDLFKTCLITKMNGGVMPPPLRTQTACESFLDTSDPLTRYLMDLRDVYDRDGTVMEHSSFGIMYSCLPSRYVIKTAAGYCRHLERFYVQSLFNKGTPQLYRGGLLKRCADISLGIGIDDTAPSLAAVSIPQAPKTIVAAVDAAAQIAQLLSTGDSPLITRSDVMPYLARTLLTMTYNVANGDYATAVGDCHYLARQLWAFVAVAKQHPGQASYFSWAQNQLGAMVPLCGTIAAASPPNMSPDRAGAFMGCSMALRTFGKQARLGVDPTAAMRSMSGECAKATPDVARVRFAEAARFCHSGVLFMSRYVNSTVETNRLVLSLAPQVFDVNNYCAAMSDFAHGLESPVVIARECCTKLDGFLPAGMLGPEGLAKRPEAIGACNEGQFARAVDLWRVVLGAIVNVDTNAANRLARHMGQFEVDRLVRVSGATDALLIDEDAPKVG